MMTVLAHRSSHRNTVLDTTCFLCGAQPETAPHLWACSARSHEWGRARRQGAELLNQKVGKRVVSVRNQLWEVAVIEQWAVALRPPSMQQFSIQCLGAHTMGIKFIRHVIEESMRVCYAHAKARATKPAESPLGPEQHNGVGVARLCLHKQAERERV